MMADYIASFLKDARFWLKFQKHARRNHAVVGLNKNLNFAGSHISKFLRPAQHEGDGRRGLTEARLTEASCGITIMLILNLSSLKTEQICCCPHCRCHHLGYSVPPVHHCTIWCRSTFGPRGSDLSNPTSLLRPRLPMAPTTDNNAKETNEALFLRDFTLLHDDKLRFYNYGKVSEIYFFFNPLTHFKDAIDFGWHYKKGMQ